MADVFTRKRRSEIMSRIRGRDTKPELLLRKLLRASGLRVLRHVASLPGTPEFVLPKEKIVLFVHGCFWHAHKGCARSRLPSSNRRFWVRKLDGNRRRDQRQVRRLREMGWRVGIFWTCLPLEVAGVTAKLRRLGAGEPLRRST